MRCLRCQHENAPAQKFCGECGAALLPPAAAREASPPTDTPSRLAGSRSGSRSALEGERKHVTVLFADMKGSLELIADRDPEEARRLIDPVIERMIEAVGRYEGTVNQTMGDGIMALFGAPVAHEDHALRACYAALRMQESIERYAQEIRTTEGVDVQVRVGLNSGEVVVRSIASGVRADYTAVGQTTHLAARMEQLARPGSILLSAGTRRLVEGHVELRPLGPVPIKGLTVPVEVYELTGAGRRRSRLQVAAASGLTRFVGRDTELAALVRALDHADTGRGRVVAVVGEPGIGKSRLVWEFVHSPAVGGWLVLEASAMPDGKDVAYLPMAALLRRYFGIGETDDGLAARGKVQASLGPDESHRFLSPILALLDALPEDGRWEALAPEQRRRRTHEALRHLLVRRSHAQPICAVIEDLHWIDGETQACLDALMDSISTARLLLIVTYRPEYQHPWASTPSYAELRLPPLQRPSAEQMLVALVGTDVSLAHLGAQLIERTDGNPFFLEESVRHLAETGELTGSPGAYRLARAPAALPLPATVQSVLAARIDRLEPDDKQVIEAAAVVGKDVPLALLEAIVEQQGDTLRQSLDRLQAGGFLHEVQLFPEIEYAFRHALTMEVASSTLLRDRRRAIDARIVRAVERLYPDSLGDHLPRLAHHARRGELWDKAALYCREAAARAFARSAHRAAAAYGEGAIEALEHLGPSPAVIEQGIDTRLDLRNALSPLGEYRKMLTALTEADRLAEKLGDRRRLGLVAAFLTNFFTLRGEFDRAIEHGERGLSIARSLHDLQVSVLTNAFLGLAYYGQGQYRRAVDVAGRARDLLLADLRYERLGMALLPAVYARTVMAWSLAELGDFEQGLPVAEDGLCIAESAEHPHSRIFAALGLGMLHLRQGDIPKTITVLERARSIWETADLPAVLLELAWPLASAYGLCGRTEEALALLEQAIAQAAALRHRYGHWLRTGAMAEALLHAGRAEEALPLAQLHVEITRLVNARGSHAWALHLLGSVAAALPPEHAAADAALTEARSVAEALGMRPLAGRCLLALGRLHLARGREGPATAALEEAARLFHHLHMPCWEDRARAEARYVSGAARAGSE